jgi:hypothetical protein
MRLIGLGIALTVAGIGLADTVTLRNGTVIQGTYLGGTARQVRIDAGDQIQTVDVDNISKIEFTASAPTSAASAAPAPAPAAAAAPVPAVAPAPAPLPARQTVQADAVAAAQPIGMELPAATNIVIRMIDGVDSQTNQVGQTFAASVDEAVALNGQTVIPRGADAVVKLADAKESGKLTGRTELTLELVSVKINGRMVELDTQGVSRESSSRGQRTAKVAGGTAAVGAIIGAIAGGGKGAAIGAVAGGAAGAGAEVVTKGQRVKIPSETILTFVTDNPVRL